MTPKVNTKDKQVAFQQSLSPAKGGEPKASDVVAGVNKLFQDYSLTEHQEILLRRLISFDAVKLETAQDIIKKELWQFFFKWREEGLAPINLTHKRSV